jgi:hypothetical protein
MPARVHSASKAGPRFLMLDTGCGVIAAIIGGQALWQQSEIIASAPCLGWLLLKIRAKTVPLFWL